MTALVGKHLEEEIGVMEKYDIIRITNCRRMIVEEGGPSYKDGMIILDFDYVASPPEGMENEGKIGNPTLWIHN